MNLRRRIYLFISYITEDYDEGIRNHQRMVNDFLDEIGSYQQVEIIHQTDDFKEKETYLALYERIILLLPQELFETIDALHQELEQQYQPEDEEA